MFFIRWVIKLCMYLRRGRLYSNFIVLLWISLSVMYRVTIVLCSTGMVCFYVVCNVQSGKLRGIACILGINCDLYIGMCLGFNVGPEILFGVWDRLLSFTILKRS